MDEKESKPLSAFLSDAEVKVVWREEERTKVGRGMITNDDENFVYLTGDKGTVIVNKRTMNPGFAGITNELFGYSNTIMVFGDAKDMLGKLMSDLKEL